MKIRLLGSTACVACVILSSCGFLSDPSVRLITDRPEMAAYVERYNARQDANKVELEYRESPSQAVLDGEQADVVVGEWLASSQLLDRFDSTADIVKPGRIDPSSFYAGLLSMGSKDNRPVLIPISFDIPAIVYFKPRLTTDLPAMLMPLELMRSMSQSFNVQGKNGFTSIGFSPLWNADFLLWTAALFGAHFKAGRGGLLSWDAEGLERAVGFLRIWLAQASGGADMDMSFAERNLVQPYYKLLATGKTLFALTPFTVFFALPEDKRRDLDFRWPSSAGMVPVQDNVLFAGVLRAAGNKRGAKSFLEWFFSPQNQRSFLEVAQSRRIPVFGITNGFSSLKSINERDIAQKYPLLLGHIPEESHLQFPEILPDNWSKIRDDTVRAWIARAAGGKESVSLSERMDEWQAAADKK